jgi:hypothetical protein
MTSEMTWGIPTSVFLQLHVALSLVGIASGFVAVWGMIGGRHLPVWAAVFLATTFLTGVTGFPLPPFGLDPPRIVGIILLCALSAAIVSLYFLSLQGSSRAVYVVGAVLSLYLNVFVAVVQAFQKIGPLHALAPTQSEPPFAVAQAVVLAGFVVIGFLAWRRFRPPFTSMSVTA